jgi:hypothetical protein
VPKHQFALKLRVVRAAESSLARQRYVSAIDVLSGIGILTPKHVDDWRKGQIDFLERVIQGNLRISTALNKVFEAQKPRPVSRMWSGLGADKVMVIPFFPEQVSVVVVGKIPSSMRRAAIPQPGEAGECWHKEFTARCRGAGRRWLRVPPPRVTAITNN